MSIRGLEREAVAFARLELNNPKLRLKDLQEWNISKFVERDGEVVLWLEVPGVYTAFPKSCDKRVSE